MRCFLIIFLSFSILAANGQRSKLTICEAIKCILEFAPAIGPYYFDKNISDSIKFCDTSGSFKECKIPNYYGKSIELVNAVPKVKELGPSEYLIIYKGQTKRTLRLTLEYRHSGAYWEFIIRKVKGRVKIFKFREVYI